MTDPDCCNPLAIEIKKKTLFEVGGAVMIGPYPSLAILLMRLAKLVEDDPGLQTRFEGFSYLKITVECIKREMP